MASTTNPACSAIGRSTWIFWLSGLDSWPWLKMTVALVMRTAMFEGQASLSGDSPEHWRCVSLGSTHPTSTAAGLPIDLFERSIAVEFAPVLGEGLAGLGVFQVGREVGEGLEHVRVLENLAAGQHQVAEAAYAIAEQQDVDIKRAVGELGQVALSAVAVLQFGEPCLERLGLDVGRYPAASVEEVLALEADRLGLVGRRAFDFPESLSQRRHAGG